VRAVTPLRTQTCRMRRGGLASCASLLLPRSTWLRVSPGSCYGTRMVAGLSTVRVLTACAPIPSCVHAYLFALHTTPLPRYLRGTAAPRTHTPDPRLTPTILPVKDRGPVLLPVRFF